MEDNFEWNPFADQPHNVGSRKQRFRQHWKYGRSYLSLFWPNLRKAVPVLLTYRQYRSGMHRFPAPVHAPFSVSVSPEMKDLPQILELLHELNISQSLMRIPSWEQEKLSTFEEFYDAFQANDIELTLALLQRRADVLQPEAWHQFVSEVFARFGRKCSFFEVGHAWNRTKWGVWDYKEYMQLAQAVFPLAEEYQVQLVGPAVIDFEFHLYPPLLRHLPFAKISSLLYVDRVGAPENTQFGWDTSRKLALLKAIVDKCATATQSLWITEFNWPLEGTGKYSPAAGRPNVSEEDQADYLVRYAILAVSSGMVERLYWWQLAAPGYGLVDNREGIWRKRPAFFALKTLRSLVSDTIFEGKFVRTGVEIFLFCKHKEIFAVGWTRGNPAEYTFPGKVTRVLSRAGEELAVQGNTVVFDGHPKYVFFEQS